MKSSSLVQDLIKKSESLRLSAYVCPAGVWTIGWGHTSDVKRGMRITQEKAQALFLEDIANVERIVDQAVKVPLTQGQYDALVSIIFNVGPGRKGARAGIVTLSNGEPSTLLRKLNARDYEGAAAQFDAWVYGGGVKLPGLVTRRAMERKFFEGKT